MGSLEKRFRRKCSSKRASGCVEWTGSTNGRYGQIKSSSPPFKHLLAHRVAYELHYGPIQEGQWVLHKCDNPLCVNWEHLFLGDRSENVADMMRKDRQKRSRFSAADVNAMRELHSGGMTMKAIAARFGVSRPNVSLLLSGKTARLA